MDAGAGWSGNMMLLGRGQRQHGESVEESTALAFLHAWYC